LICILKKHGFKWIRESRHPIYSNGKISVPIPHYSGDIPAPTFKNIMRIARIHKNEWKK